MDADPVHAGNEDETRDASSTLAPPTLEQFVDRIATRAFRFAEAGLRNRDDAQDAVQDTMIRMLLIATGPLPNGRHGIQRWPHMPPGQREEMRTLDDAGRPALRERWKTMTSEQRRAWVEAKPPAERRRRERRDQR